MADLETRIGHTLRLVREAIRAIEADPTVFRGAIERVEKLNEGLPVIPSDKPDVLLREIECILAGAMEHLEG